MWSVGCFYGTGKELVEKAYKDSQISGDCYKMAVQTAGKIFAVTTKGDKKNADESMSVLR